MGKVGEKPSDRKGEVTIISCGTTKGPITFRLIRDWSPNGYDRAVALFSKGYYDNSHFFRVVPKFLVQFGISYTSDRSLRKFASSTIPDDPQLDPPIPFNEGVVSFAGGGPNSRTSQLFIAYGRVPSLGTQLWETPIGVIDEGMENAHQFYSGYGDMPPWGKAPEQSRIRKEGRKYIDKKFPLIDQFETCHVQKQQESQPVKKEENTDDLAKKMKNNPIGKDGNKVLHDMVGNGRDSGRTAQQLRNLRRLENDLKSDVDLQTIAIVVVVLVLFSIFCLGRRRRRRNQDKTS